MTAHAQRLETFRSLRAEIEASILPLASSIDGRRFSFQASVEGLALRVGGYTMLEGDGGGVLGQVRSLALVEVDVAEVGLTGDGRDDIDVRTRLPIRVARGEGVLLDRGGAPFHDRLARPATPAEMQAWMADTAPRRSALAVGGLSLVEGVPLALDAGGFDRHTFLCGQSGSGKSYSLGLVLEQLLLETDLRIVILDPNSDFARLTEIRERARRRARRALGRPRARDLRALGGRGGRGAAAAALRRPRPGDPGRRCCGSTRSPTARSTPSSPRSSRSSGRTAWPSSPRPTAPEARSLRVRADNLGVSRWGVWAREDPGSTLDALDDPDVRCLVVDLGSLPTREEQVLAAGSVLRRLWDRRGDRRPVLAVVDEAHNVCPAAPEDPLTALATEHAVRIAGEGRKYGIYLLVSTQRPQKVHEHVISQCDNLVLMRLNSAADCGFIAGLFGFAPPGLVDLATDFGLGEALVAGKLASHPALLRFGARVAREGGGDVDASWARPTGR